MRKISFNQFAKVYNFVELLPNQSKTILRIDIPVNAKGFLIALATNWFSNTKIEWIIDGERIEMLERAVGSVDKPVKLDPPYVINHHLEFIGYNNSANVVKLEVMVDGYIVYF